MHDIITCRRLGFIVALLFAPAASAQPDAEGISAFVDCAYIQNDDARLDCYDLAAAAVRAGERGSTSAAAADEPAAPARRPEAQQQGPSPADESLGAGAGARSARADANANANAGAVNDDRSRADAENDGGLANARREARDDGDEVEPTVTIVEVRAVVPGRAVFVTSDGDAFVQTGGAMRLRLPDVPFEARLTSGLIGGAFLRPDGTRLRIRVSLRD